MLTRQVLAEGLGSIAAHMEAVADESNTLDGQLGDGDLGVTMVRCARAVTDLLPDQRDDVGLALMQVAQAFTHTSGTSLGTLTATGLMAEAKEQRGRGSAEWAEISRLLTAAFERMRDRGKASLGNKTVQDALDAAAEATAGQVEPGAIVQEASDAVDATMDRMRNEPARIGRAQIFGEKIFGMDDPGMLALRRVLDALKTWRGADNAGIWRSHQHVDDELDPRGGRADRDRGRPLRGGFHRDRAAKPARCRCTPRPRAAGEISDAQSARWDCRRKTLPRSTRTAPSHI